MAISGPVYAVVDTDARNVVRTGMFGQQLFPSESEAEEVADRFPEYEVYKLESQG